MHRFYRLSKDQNAELTTLIETIPDLVWLKNPKGVYLECNPAIERFYGMSRDAVIGKTTRDLFPDRVALSQGTRMMVHVDSFTSRDGWFGRCGPPPTAKRNCTYGNFLTFVPTL
ncbi:MAG: PAS domain S-box protein [Sulfuritalea sp.]|nr:PAS domain S-box protein [Sulfuritalea sp.]